MFSKSLRAIKADRNKTGLWQIACRSVYSWFYCLLMKDVNNINNDEANSRFSRFCKPAKLSTWHALIV